MDLSQLDKIINERIVELRQLESNARHRSLQISYQDKRDELEALLLRIHGVFATRQAREANGCH